MVIYVRNIIEMAIVSNEDYAEFRLPFSVSLRKTDGDVLGYVYDVVSCHFQYEDIIRSFLERYIESKIEIAEHSN